MDTSSYSDTYMSQCGSLQEKKYPSMCFILCSIIDSTWNDVFYLMWIFKTTEETTVLQMMLLWLEVFSAL